MADPQPLEIVLYPDPSLTQRCREITDEEIKAGKADNWDLNELAQRMHVTMHTAEGIGLAAPQIGVALRLFVVEIAKHPAGALTILNPVLSDPKGSAVEEEGCLSIPHVRAKVKRAKVLTLTGVDLKGQPIKIDAEDLLARVFQHETDHLDGKLFIDRIGMTSKLMVRKQLIELEEDYALAKKKSVAAKK